MPDRRRQSGEDYLQPFCNKIAERWCHSAIWYMHHIDSRHDLEQFARQLDHTADAGRSEIDFARVGLGVGDEFGDRLGGKRGMHYLDKRPTGDARDRYNIADDVEAELVIECRMNCFRVVDKQKRVAVW
jgi:hypothetical protein